MTRANLRRSELCAVELLCCQGLSSIYELSVLDVRRLSLPVSVIFESFAGFCRETGVPRNTFAPRLHASAEGITLRRGGTFVILYDERTRSRARLNWTLAHELGHVMLGHSGEGAAHEEREANAFAASLLCPAAAVRFLALKSRTPLDAEALCRIFPLSRDAAVYRLRELSRPTSRAMTDAEINLLLCLFGRLPEQEHETLKL